MVNILSSQMFIIIVFSAQNQLLTKGMVILRDKIRFYEGTTDLMQSLERHHGVSELRISQLCFCTCVINVGQKLLDSLAETWDFFFCDVLSMLQAIFHPVQVHNHQKSLLVFVFAAQRMNFKHFCYSLCPSPCVQGKEPSVRQLALLHFRNTIVLSVKLEDALSRPRARVPPSVTQMLLILQVGLQAWSQLTHWLFLFSIWQISTKTLS